VRFHPELLVGFSIGLVATCPHGPFPVLLTKKTNTPAPFVWSFSRERMKRAIAAGESGAVKPDDEDKYDDDDDDEWLRRGNGHAD